MSVLISNDPDITLAHRTVIWFYFPSTNLNSEEPKMQFLLDICFMLFQGETQMNTTTIDVMPQIV